MKERSKKVTSPQGKLVDGVVVPIVESTERFSEVILKDGSILQTKLSVLEVVRIENQWDNEGNPSYVVKSTNVVAVSESPPKLMKKNQ